MCTVYWLNIAQWALYDISIVHSVCYRDSLPQILQSIRVDFSKWKQLNYSIRDGGWYECQCLRLTGYGFTEPKVFMDEETLFLIWFLDNCKKIPLANRMRMLSLNSSDQWACKQGHSSKLAFSCSNLNINPIYAIFRAVFTNCISKGRLCKPPALLQLFVPVLRWDSEPVGMSRADTLWSQ